MRTFLLRTQTKLRKTVSFCPTPSFCIRLEVYQEGTNQKQYCCMRMNDGEDSCFNYGRVERHWQLCLNFGHQFLILLHPMTSRDINPPYSFVVCSLHFWKYFSPPILNIYIKYNIGLRSKLRGKSNVLVNNDQAEESWVCRPSESV